MDAEIIQLPTTMERQWRVYEIALQKLMRENGVDAETSKAVLDRVKPIYLRCATPHEIPQGSSPEIVLWEINQWVNRVSTDLLTEIVVRELALINLRGKAG